MALQVVISLLALFGPFSFAACARYQEPRRSGCESTAWRSGFLWSKSVAPTPCPTTRPWKPQLIHKLQDLHARWAASASALPSNSKLAIPIDLINAL
jgi:hypothetical protein